MSLTAHSAVILPDVCLSHLSMWHRKPLWPHCWRPLNAAHTAAWSICALVPRPHLHCGGWRGGRGTGILALPNSRSACLPALRDGAGWKTMVLLSCPSRSHKACHHNEHIHWGAAAVAACYVQKLIGEDKQCLLLQTEFSDAKFISLLLLSFCTS